MTAGTSSTAEVRWFGEDSLGCTLLDVRRTAIIFAQTGPTQLRLWTASYVNASKLRGHAKLGVAAHALDVRLATSACSPACTSTLIFCTRFSGTCTPSISSTSRARAPNSARALSSASYDSWSQDLSRRYLDDGSAQSTRVLKSVTKRLIAKIRTSRRSATTTPNPPRTSSPFCTPRTPSVHLARRHATLQKVVLTAAQAAPLPVWAYWRRPHAAGVGATARAGGRGGRGGERITAAVAQHLPGLVEAWRAERKRQLLGLLPRAGELDGADPARGGARGDADAGTDDDEVRLDLATSLFACLGSWVPGRRGAASSGGWARAKRTCAAGPFRASGRGESAAPRAAAVLVRLVAAVLVRLAGRDPARRRWMGWTRGMCGGRGGGAGAGGRARAEGADMAGGRAACGGGRARSRAGACGGCGVGGAVARQERADGAHKDRAWVCVAHFDEHVVREEAQERHIRSKTRTSRSSSACVAVLLSEEGLVAEYRCAHCVDVLPRVVWLFSITMRALGRHARSRCRTRGGLDARGADRGRAFPGEQRGGTDADAAGCFTRRVLPVIRGLHSRLFPHFSSMLVSEIDDFWRTRFSSKFKIPVAILEPRVYRSS
ncbi:hypothetical protein C8J57DRAFT_1475119 [Mycena rebaudengoi]|nr:hypothetical protein C8J57DRAFT_1475119 [Mycena rebaudengoi]